VPQKLYGGNSFVVANILGKICWIFTPLSPSPVEGEGWVRVEPYLEFAFKYSLIKSSSNESRPPKTYRTFPR